MHHLKSSLWFMPGTVVSRAHNLSPRPCATSTQATKRGGLPCGSLLPNGKLLPTTNHPRPSIRPDARRSGALCSTHLRPTARRGPDDQGLQLKVATAGRRSTKKQQSGQLMARTLRDMSWCTAPTSPGNVGGKQAPAMTACAALHGNRPRLENNPSPRPILHSDQCPLLSQAA